MRTLVYLFKVKMPFVEIDANNIEQAKQFFLEENVIINKVWREIDGPN